MALLCVGEFVQHILQIVADHQMMAMGVLTMLNICIRPGAGCGEGAAGGYLQAVGWPARAAMRFFARLPRLASETISRSSARSWRIDSG